MVLDYEKNFTYDGSNMQGNDHYYTNDKSKCPDSANFAGKEKYPDKVMVWVAISNQMIYSSHYFVHRSLKQSIEKFI